MKWLRIDWTFPKEGENQAICTKDTMVVRIFVTFTAVPANDQNILHVQNAAAKARDTDNATTNRSPLMT